MASWLNDVTYADVRALNVAVENLKIQLSTIFKFYRKKDSNWFFCRKIKKIDNFLHMLSTFQCVVGLDTMKNSPL